MFDSNDTFVISKKINSASLSIPFNFPPDPTGEYEFIWKGTGALFTASPTLGIRWKNGKVGSVESSKMHLYMTTISRSILNPITFSPIDGKSFPPTSEGEFCNAIQSDVLNDPHYVYTSFATPGSTIYLEFGDFSLGPSSSTRTPLKSISYTDLHSAQFPNNVRIYFPKTQSDLWTTESTLIQVSDVFKIALSSEFEEGKLLNEITFEGSTQEKDFDDSDDESNKGLRKEDERIPSGAPFKQIKIENISHSTFRAFLHWLETSQITFAPLTSNSRSHPGLFGSFTTLVNRRAAREATMNLTIKNVALPRPVSPNSIYRLAHYYNIPTLQQLALENLKSQLTIESVALEVFSDLSAKYEEVRNMEIDFTIKNWNAVAQSWGMKEVENLIEQDELPSFASVAVKLYQKLRI